MSCRWARCVGVAWRRGLDSKSGAATLFQVEAQTKGTGARQGVRKLHLQVMCSNRAMGFYLLEIAYDAGSL